MRSIVYANPAWTNSALLRQWNDLEKIVGSKLMPKVERHTADKLVAVEYGSGAYGTVIPSNKKGVVIKVTSDPSEAHFAFIATNKLRRYPEGLVKYGRVLQLRGTHDGRPIFVIWREEAYDVGKVVSQETANELEIIRDSADPAFRLSSSPEPERSIYTREILKSAKRYRGRTGYERGGRGPGPFEQIFLWFQGSAIRAGFNVDKARAVADDIAHEPEAKLVGKTIRDLIDHGIVLADVHAGNIGNVRRGGKKVAVITDPGNVGFLYDEYLSYSVPTVEQVLGRAYRTSEVTTRREKPSRAVANPVDIVRPLPWQMKVWKERPDVRSRVIDKALYRAADSGRSVLVEAPTSFYVHPDGSIDAIPVR